MWVFRPNFLRALTTAIRRSGCNGPSSCYLLLSWEVETCWIKRARLGEENRRDNAAGQGGCLRYDICFIATALPWAKPGISALLAYRWRWMQPLLVLP